jgi:hypothetical protein
MTAPHTFLTLGQAAKATGKSKGTISNAIKSGRLRVAIREANAYKIDPADLFNTFEALNTTKRTENVYNEQYETPPEHHKITQLELELKHARELLEIERINHAETKVEKLRLLDTLENQTRLLTHITAETAGQKQNKKGFLGWLTGKK